MIEVDMKKGYIFDIQRFSINDGPGIRTTVFFKGCPLNCLWCHNPESKSKNAEIFFDSEKCAGCGACEAVCPERCHKISAAASEDGAAAHSFDRERCNGCGRCADACVYGALEAVGRCVSVNEVLEEVKKDTIFYENSGGGMTLSGGEPMLQADFAIELLREAKAAGLHTCIETCGFGNSEKYLEMLSLVDIFLYDYKESDTDKHKSYTGVSNDLILKNLEMLSEKGAHIVLRCPIIPSLNDRPEHLRAIAEVANRYSGIKEINVEPYHPLGAGKAKRLGKEYVLEELPFTEKEMCDMWISEISKFTDIPVKKA